MRNSPKQFEQYRASIGRPLPAPSVSVELRNEAAKLRQLGQSLLAKAAKLDELADRSDLERGIVQ